MPHRILIIDDSEVILLSTRSKLASRGHDVTASSKFDAATVQAPEGWDLILVDVNLAAEGPADESILVRFGDDLAQFLRRGLRVQAPIVLYSDLPEEELRRRAERCGAHAYVCKGWGLERLADRIDELLAG
jgi:DNA-binding response OmpR family regulator